MLCRGTQHARLDKRSPNSFTEGWDGMRHIYPDLYHNDQKIQDYSVRDDAAAEHVKVLIEMLLSGSSRRLWQV